MDRKLQIIFFVVRDDEAITVSVPVYEVGSVLFMTSINQIEECRIEHTGGWS